jgi:hypothetical protein
MEPSPSIPDIDLASRKRKIKLTARVTDNADPLLPKNKKARAEDRPQASKQKIKPSKAAQSTGSTSKAGKATNTVQAPQRRPSVEIEEVPDEGDHIVKRASMQVVLDVDADPLDISDVETEPEAMEESCEAELSKNFNNTFYQIHLHVTCQSVYQKIGLLLSMPSFTQPPLSYTSPNVVYTPSNALLRAVEPRMAGRLDAILIPATGSQLATYANTPSFAGVRRRLKPQTEQRMRRLPVEQ